MRLDPAKLRTHYQDFLDPRGAPRRILLTGHSHQAWPAAAREGTLEAYECAAARVDDKWDEVFSAQDDLRAHLSARIGGAPREYAFAPNTHELVARWLSALPLDRRPRLLSTDGEFHSAFRQLRRLSEWPGIEVTLAPAEPAETLCARLADALDERTVGVLVSSVLFSTATVVPGLDALIARAERVGASVMIDGYHAFDAVEFTVPDGAFFVSGGYKYAQWGEGACFLRVPPGCALRPVYTGWFAGFASLSDRRAAGPVAYETDGAERFAGSTFDPTSVFRARAVARFFDREGLTVSALRATSLAQTERILARTEGLPGVTLASPRDPARRGGFVALRTPRAGALVTALRAEGVYADSRGDLLRLGPAPYVTDDEIDVGTDILRSLVLAD